MADSGGAFDGVAGSLRDCEGACFFSSCLRGFAQCDGRIELWKSSLFFAPFALVQEQVEKKTEKFARGTEQRHVLDSAQTDPGREHDIAGVTLMPRERFEAIGPRSKP